MSLSDQNWKVVFAKIESVQAGSFSHGDVEILMNAVRAEERARAVEVVRPFAAVEAMSGRAPESPVGVLRSVTTRHMSTWSTGGLNAGHFHAAAAYITDSQDTGQ